MSNHYFRFKQFTLNQDQCAMKVSTDSCILGAYASHKMPETIIDLGTGTGILALMMAQRYLTSSIDCVEIDRKASIQASSNIDSSPWKDRIIVFNDSIQNFTAKTAKSYDLIISNPPYFEAHLLSHQSDKNLAKHNSNLGFKELILSINKLISKEGHCYIILPPAQFLKFDDEIRKSGFHLFDKLSIFNKPGKPTYRIIGGYSKKTSPNKYRNLLIKDDSNAYSPEFKKLLKAFYLAF